MAWPPPSPWARVLLAALLSVSLPGNTGKSTVIHCPPGWRHRFQGIAVTQPFPDSLPLNRRLLHTSRAGAVEAVDHQREGSRLEEEGKGDLLGEPRPQRNNCGSHRGAESFIGIGRRD